MNPELGGMEWLVDAYGCQPYGLRDANVLRDICQQVVADLGLNIVGQPQWHTFPGPGGVTGLYLLSESHLACHTYPETQLATFNLYCCRRRPAWPWAEKLAVLLGAQSCRILQAARGLAAEAVPAQFTEVG